MSNQVTFLVFVTIIGVVAEFATAAKHEITSTSKVDWGVWSSWKMCPSGYARGFQLSTEPQLFRFEDDNTALNAIRLLCATEANPSDLRSTQYGAQWGKWGQRFFCPGNEFLTGFQLRVQNPLKGLQDNTGTNNIRFFCNNVTLEGDGLTGGEWVQTSHHCKEGHYVCGMRVQIDNQKATGIFRRRFKDDDDTALNNVELSCCEDPTNNQMQIVTRQNNLTSSTGIAIKQELVK